MRPLMLIAAAAMALGACGKNGQQDTNQVSGESLTAESIVSNDVTAIDAVTGDDANMAADVDLNYGDLTVNEPEASTNSTARSRPTATRPATQPAPTAENNATAAANSATNAQ
jgi:hypothetical protein